MLKRWLLRRRGRSGGPRIGWIASHTLHGGSRRLAALPPAVAMRIRNPARWLEVNAGIHSELYRRGSRYDVVVFVKAMDAACQEEARTLQEAGVPVVFDANVNYYDVWGDYDVPGTRPTDEQRRHAAAMTELADHVVADSSYLLEVVRRFNRNATHIPDNVDLDVYSGLRRHDGAGRIRLVWSGVAKKASHLGILAGVLRSLDGLELVLVSDGRPAGLDELAAIVPCSVVRFSDRRYARVLRHCDVIVSPKRLANAYEVAHTEYKITLGMAVGLPAVASPQQSYVEAVSWKGGGIIADGQEEWRSALERLRDDVTLRRELGERARETVLERYATPVIARAWRDLLLSLR